MRTVARLLSFAAAIAILALVGCGRESDSESGAFAKSKRGGYLRLVNLSGEPLQLYFGNRQFFVAGHAASTAFALYRPGKHRADLIFGDRRATASLDLEVHSEETLSLYVMAAKPLKVIQIRDDPRTGKPDAASIRLVNLTERPLTAKFAAQEVSAAPGAASPTLSMPLDTLSVRIDGVDRDPKPLQPDAGDAYTLVVYPAASGNSCLVLRTSARMETQVGGPSAAG